MVLCFELLTQSVGRNLEWDLDNLLGLVDHILSSDEFGKVFVGYLLAILIFVRCCEGRRNLLADAEIPARGWLLIYV